MLKELKNNKNGVVFVTVLMIIIVMIVLCISIISMNVSQVMIAESEIKRIQGEVLALGALALVFANQMSSTPGDTITYSRDLGDVTYTVNAYVNQAATGPIGGTNPIFIDISF